MKQWELEYGANVNPDGRITFKVWAPKCNKIDVEINKDNRTVILPMLKHEDDCFYAETGEVNESDTYFYILDGDKKRPDPVSRYIPGSIHGPSVIVNKDKYTWNDNNWQGIKLSDLVFYEIHTGTFTDQGTFRGIMQKLDYLKSLGITCIEIMPVNQFPGERNWGYDGGSLYAVQNSYGTCNDLKELVDMCHAKGLAVCMDVVYNHLGPEGNYLNDYGHYFTDKYNTPWGWAVNFDGKYSNFVRDFFINNALYWITEYHIDVLRLDAVHGIFDFGAYHFLEELNDKVKEYSEDLNYTPILIAESDLNDARLLHSKEQGGYNLGGQWSDDFHHSLHSIVTNEKTGYYLDFGKIEHLKDSLKRAFVYNGMYSDYRRRYHGNSTDKLKPVNFVISAQNHDQVGNRAIGDRLSVNISFDLQKIIPVLLFLSPFIPFIFMGEEYGETAYFQYFVDHSDKNLIEAVRNGRFEEFKAFGWESVPDPKAEKTFNDSKLNWDRPGMDNHKHLLGLYKDLIELRKKSLDINSIKFDSYEVYYDENKKWIALEYLEHVKDFTGYIVSFNDEPVEIESPFKKHDLKTILHTGFKKYNGSIENAPGIAGNSKIVLQPQCGIVFE